MSRFQCIECEHEHGTATGCPRCQVQGAQVEICGSHGARHVHRCPACRTLTRSQSGI
ncbi:rubredoxin [Sphaerisporangium rubeum]|uniref:Rubredoxin n=1 Tax=Sphaerisporangium rubeum TaxID=321317 RepID=A0A7X0M8G4_9ACTN|nr:rubredoxin [Sphaerisporangium rubeum]